MSKILLLTVASMLLCFTVFAANEIKIGSINDLTGATSDVGKDVALGVKECVAYINDTGGINGKRIKLLLQDYGYRLPRKPTSYTSVSRIMTRFRFY